MKLRSLPRSVSLLTVALLEATSHHGAANAFSLPIVGRQMSRETRLARRAVDMNGAFGNGSTSVANSGDTLYSCNVTLGGAEFEVLIDTGSSDLWVAGTVPHTTSLNIAASVSYAKGEASGTINTANLTFDEYVIPNQAYINVVPSADNPPSQGLIGLGPSKASNVRQLVNSAAGNTPLDRIFLQNKTTPNFISVLLSRVSDDPAGSVPQTGQLTVGTVIPVLEAINSQKKLPALVDADGIQHWQTVMDPNGIIGPDGQNIVTNSTVSSSDGTAQQLRVVFDTGFTFPQVTQDVADAIYGRVPDAQWVPGDGNPGYWRVPCSYELNVTFLFNGVKYPIAPLDLTMVETVDTSTGNPVHCMSTFQQISPTVADHSKFGAFDMILGMAFLRNAYLLIDFGDFVDGSSSSVGDPFIQLLSTTELASAHQDFVKTRLGGVDTTGSQAALVPADQGQHSPAVANPNQNTDGNSVTKVLNNAKNKVENLFTHSVWFIVAVSVGAFIIAALIGLCIFRKCRQRRSKVRTEGAFLPSMGSYKPLRDSTVTVPGARPESPVWDHNVNNHGYGYAATGQYSEPNYHYGGRY